MSILSVMKKTSRRGKQLLPHHSQHSVFRRTLELFPKRFKLWFFAILIAIPVILLLVGLSFLSSDTMTFDRDSHATSTPVKKIVKAKVVPLDTKDYDRRMQVLANYPVSTSTANGVVSAATTTVNIWPVKTVYPNTGAILPNKRIIAYYGNLYSTKMGALGEYPEDEMLRRLQAEVKKWSEADPSTPAIPALHYIAVTAQVSKGADGKYRLRMPDSQIDEVLRMAEKVDGIVFLDIQVGLSTLQSELPLLEKYLKMPNVHLGIDAEFSMKGGDRPGTVVGTFDATDINYAANYLALIVKENNIPPKVLVVHRYTQMMITNYKKITPLPEVQIVMHMDGWGGPAKKKNTYQRFVYNEPVQFAGFKLFYKHDIRDPGTTLLSPEELLKLKPRPVYIQYQ